jgi:hypothetical protein
LEGISRLNGESGAEILGLSTYCGQSRDRSTISCIPDGILRGLIDPAIMVRPMLWLVSRNADGITGKRFNASRLDLSLAEAAAAAMAVESAGWIAEA